VINTQLIYLSVLKGAITINISVLNAQDTVALITTSTAINYTGEAIEYIYSLTNGHPYFTQLIVPPCSIMYTIHPMLPRPNSNATPLVGTEIVGSILPTVFMTGESVFYWIWSSFPDTHRFFYLCWQKKEPNKSDGNHQHVTISSALCKPINLS